MTTATPRLFHGDGCASAAEFSPCGAYRYSLSRTWGEDPPACFVMLNPSTADAHEDDPTIRRCIDFARQWGTGGLRVANIYALRSTDPAGLRSVTDPVGQDNDAAILRAVDGASIVIVAWGTKAIDDRPQRVAALLVDYDLYALRINADGSPGHPLYLPKRVERLKWASARTASRTACTGRTADSQLVVRASTVN